MKIASGTIFYNDCKSLERTLNSLKDKVDWMICIDGRFKHFKDDMAMWSTDGSRELVKSYDNAIMLTVANTYEVQKRQAYVDFCTLNKYDWLLIIDSDEYVLEYKEEEFKKELIRVQTEHPWRSYNVFAVMCEVNSANYDHIVHEFSGANAPKPTAQKQFAHYPRLWARPYEMEYNVLHYHFRNKNPTHSLHYQECNAAMSIIPGMTLGHDHI